MSSAEIENEKEWRRHILDRLSSIDEKLGQKIDELENEQNKIYRELEGVKVWLWIWRALGSTALGLILWYLELWHLK